MKNKKSNHNLFISKSATSTTAQGLVRESQFKTSRFHISITQYVYILIIQNILSLTHQFQSFQLKYSFKETSFLHSKNEGKLDWVHHDVCHQVDHQDACHQFHHNFIFISVQILVFWFSRDFLKKSLSLKVSKGRVRTETVKIAEIDNINCIKNQETGTINTQITNFGKACFNSKFHSHFHIIFINAIAIMIRANIK